MSSAFVKFCLESEINLIVNKINNIVKTTDQRIIDFKESVVNFPRLSSSIDGFLNVLVLSDGSTVYLPFSVRSSSDNTKSKEFNINVPFKFVISKSDIFAFLR